MAAWITIPAEYLRLYRHPLPYAQIIHARAQGGDCAGYLVALRDRIYCKRMGAMIDVYIRAADPNPFYLYQDLSLRRHRGFHFLKYDIPWLHHNLLQHFGPLSLWLPDDHFDGLGTLLHQNGLFDLVHGETVCDQRFNF